MKKKKKQPEPSPFDAWYTEHYGPRPTKKNIKELSLRLFDIEDDAENLRSLILQTENWETSRRAAKAGWNASASTDQAIPAEKDYVHKPY